MSTNCTAKPTSPQRLKHRVKVGIEATSWTEDAALSGTIGDTEGIGAGCLPLDVASLVQVDEHKESQENNVDPSFP